MNPLLGGAAILTQIDVERPIVTPEVPWFDLSPMLVLLGAALVILLVSALSRGRAPAGTWSIITAVAGLGAAVLSAVLWSDVQSGDGARSIVAGAIGIDGFSMFFWILLSGVVTAVVLFADQYLRREGLAEPEFFSLVLLATVGGMVMAAADDLIVLFLGLETLSIALYVLAGFHARRLASQEAALKYFVLGAFSSAFFLYGIALVYGATGSTNMAEIAGFLAENVLLDNAVLLAGFAMLLVGFAFKVSAVPFHAWAPDVYQGSPLPSTGYMAAATKAAAFAALLRVFLVTFDVYQTDWRPIVWVLAVLTLVVGSLLAIVQSDVKRMLAYSSIANAGFLLVAVEAASAKGISAALFYVLVYDVAIVAAFGVLAVVAPRGDGRHSLDLYRGMAQRRPILSAAFLVVLLSLAGIPGTAGFLGKFYVVEASVDRGQYVLSVIAMLSAVVLAFVYLRLVATMFFPSSDEEPPPHRRVPVVAGIGLALVVGWVVVVGVFPAPVVDFARDSVPVLIAGR